MVFPLWTITIREVNLGCIIMMENTMFSLLCWLSTSSFWFVLKIEIASPLSQFTNVVFHQQNYLHFYESKDLIVEKWNRKLDVVDVGQKLFKTSTPISSTQKGALRKKFWWLSKSKNWISLWKKHPRKTLYYNFLYTGTKQFCSMLVWKVIWHQI